MDNEQLIRIFDTLPPTERSAFVLAQLAIQKAKAESELEARRAETEARRAETETRRAEAESRRTEAEARRAEFIRNLSPEELARHEKILEYTRVTEEKKAERNRQLADLRRATLEDMKTRSFRDIIFVAATIVAITGLSKAFHDVSKAENAAKTGIVAMYALIGVAITAGFQFVTDQVTLMSKIHAGHKQLLTYIEIEAGRADDTDVRAMLEEDRLENSSFGVVEILDVMMSVAREGTAKVRRRFPRSEEEIMEGRQQV